jgi:uncharacterized protein (DUF58 family)
VKTVIAASSTDANPESDSMCRLVRPRTVRGMSVITSGPGSSSSTASAQRQMYRELREQAMREQRRRQQKIERLVQQHGQRALKTFRHPSR